jgi:hypothetical protein
MYINVTTEPAPVVVRRYEQIFTAYVRYKALDLGRNTHVQRRHFVGASTSWMSEEEHEALMTAAAEW